MPTPLRVALVRALRRTQSLYRDTTQKKKLDRQTEDMRRIPASAVVGLPITGLPLGEGMYVARRNILDLPLYLPSLLGSQLI